MPGRLGSEATPLQVDGPAVRSAARRRPVRTALAACPPDDQEVLLQVSGGLPDALCELYARHARTLMTVARRVVGSEEDAEEVLQEVFVHVWKQARHYDPRRSSVTTWLFLITRSRAIDRLRSRQTSERTLAGIRQQPRPSHASPEGARSVLDQQRRHRIRHALAQLPSEQRQVLDLAFFQGLTHRQIARHTGVPLGTVKTRTVLGMKKLRRALAKEVTQLL